MSKRKYGDRALRKSVRRYRHHRFMCGLDPEAEELVRYREKEEGIDNHSLMASKLIKRGAAVEFDNKLLKLKLKKQYHSFESLIVLSNNHTRFLEKALNESLLFIRKVVGFDFEFVDGNPNTKNIREYMEGKLLLEYCRKHPIDGGQLFNLLTNTMEGQRSHCLLEQMTEETELEIGRFAFDDTTETTHAPENA